MIKTRAVLAAAYRGRSSTLQTHAVNVRTDLALCGRVKPESIADESATDENAPATCPLCAKRDPRRATRANDGPFVLKSLLQF